EEEATLQIRGVNRRIDLRLRCRRSAQQPASQFPRDRARNFVLEGKYIGDLAIVGLRPDVIAILGVDELRRDAHEIALAPAAAFQNGANVKRPSDFSNCDALFPKSER